MIEFALGILLLPLMFLFMGGLWWLAGWVLKLESEWWIGVIILLGGVMTVWLLSWFAQLLGVKLTAQGSGSMYHVTYGSKMSFMPNLGYMNHYFVIGGFSGLVMMRIVGWLWEAWRRYRDSKAKISTRDKENLNDERKPKA